MATSSLNSAPQQPPPGSRRRRGGVVLPLLLITIGATALLHNAGLLPAFAWGSLWRLWPLVLVLVGVDLLWGARRHRGVWVLLALVLGGLAVAAVGATTFGPARFGRSGDLVTTSSQTPPLGAAQQADVTVRFGAGDLRIASLAPGAGDHLATTSYDGPPAFRPEASYTVSNGTARLLYQARGRRFGPFPFGFPPFGAPTGLSSLGLQLTPTIPLSLNLQTGASDVRLDLSQLRVSRLDLSTGASTTWLRLPEAAGATTAHVSSGAATLTVEVPQGVAAQITYRGGLSTLKVDEARFPSTGAQTYRSPTYDTAPNRVDLTLETGASTVTIQ